MIPAVYSTIVIAKLTADTLPLGVTSIPFVPPLPLPIIIIVASLLVVWKGSGGLSLDHVMLSKRE